MIEFIRKLWIWFDLWLTEDLLNHINTELNEGVICWSLLNAHWELQYGSAKTAQRELNDFKYFVKNRFQLLKNKK